MKRCDPRAYARCPDRERCGPNIHAYFAEGSECDKFNQKILEAPMTNADRIRALSDEELAKFLDDCNSQGCVCPTRNCKESCKLCIEEWLQQPAEEEAK